jgi:hypothetical protein
MFLHGLVDTSSLCSVRVLKRLIGHFPFVILRKVRREKIAKNGESFGSHNCRLNGPPGQPTGMLFDLFLFVAVLGANEVERAIE